MAHALHVATVRRLRQRDLLPSDLIYLYVSTNALPTYLMTYFISLSLSLFFFFFNRTVTTTSLVIEFASNLVSLVFETIDTAPCVVLYGVDSVRFPKRSRIFWIFRRKTIDNLYHTCMMACANALLPVKCKLLAIL